MAEKFIRDGRFRNFIKHNKLLVVVFLSYITLIVLTPEKGMAALSSSGYYLKEMFEVLPVIFLLTIGIDVLVPKSWIIENLGEGAGIKGGLLALLFGSVSAGPIYAAFPICKMLLKKGAGIANIIIILSTWAVVKVPMLANEAKFLGIEFMLMRWLLTVVAIFIMGYVLARLVKTKDLPEEQLDTNELIQTTYCVGCGVCVRMAPQFFELVEGKAIIKDEIDKETLQTIHLEEFEAVAVGCPVKAIHLSH